MAQAKKKKRFYDVEMPIINKQTQILAYELSELDGKFIKYDLTRILRGKSILIQFKVAVKDNQAIATPKGIVLMPYFLRRMIRKGTDYVEDSFTADCKDATFKIKPFLITRRKVSKRVRRGLREKAQEEIKKYLKDKPSSRIFEEILKNKMQKELSMLLKKIYPLSLCEIKSLDIEKELDVKEAPKNSEKKLEDPAEKTEKKERKSKKKEAKENNSEEEKE
jgi:ribosomal protein S3AE